VGRENLGATRARNHVLTGNSSYWGGGLVRNSPTVLTDLFGADIGAMIGQEYPSIERALGVSDGFEPAEVSVGNRRLQEVAVLPGKRRGIWADFVEQRVTCLTDTAITGVRFDSQGRIEGVAVRTASSESLELAASHVALCMGVIDSNLFVEKWLRSRLPESLRPLVGTRLHDHWSVPVAGISWRASPTVEPLFPPKFRSGIVTGRRLVLDRGFFHVVADLDTTPPYDRVKALMKARQRGAGPFALLGAAAATMASPLGMARAGLHYLSHHELHIPDGSEVRLVLDFESAGDPRNRVVGTDDGADLHWELREEDYARFEQMVRANREWWESLWTEARCDARWLFRTSAPEDLQRYLTEHAIDAYHMGGGLQPDAERMQGVTERNGTLRGCTNVFVNGTAFFNRPGPANPVLTLLARATIFVRDLVKGEVHG
jgi:hypothetical protein